MHPYYVYSSETDVNNLSFDIGLVELKDSINKGKKNLSSNKNQFDNPLYLLFFSDAVSIVATPIIGEVLNLNGGELYLAGFGKHSDDLPSNEKLSWIRAKIVPDNDVNNFQIFSETSFLYFSFQLL